MNQKNSLELDKCFIDTDDPIDLFENWFNEAIKSEPNDPNAFSLATSDNRGFPSVRIVLLKGYSKNGFIFYTNLNSQKSLSIKENPKGEMCFHWKSLSRQVRINGSISQVSDKEADNYFNTRDHKSRIGAWASRQSEILNNRQELLDSIEKYNKKFNDDKKIPRPNFWSGWSLLPTGIEFWLQGENRIHQRLKKIKKENNNWVKFLLNP